MSAIVGRMVNNLLGFGSHAAEEEKSAPVNVPPADKARLQKLAEKINNVQERRNRTATLVDGVWFDTDLSAITTLADLRVAVEWDPEMREELISKLKLAKSIETMNQLFPFLERLKKVSYEVLEQVSLVSLQFVQGSAHPENSTVADALIEDKAFIAIPVQALRLHENLKPLAARMNCLYSERPDLLVTLARMPLSNPLELPAAKLGLMPSVQIMSISKELPPEAFGLLADDQVTLLNFSKLSSEQIIQCVRGESDDEKIIQRRLSLLSLEQLVQVINAARGDFLTHFPIELLGKVPMAAMSKEQIAGLFTHYRIPEEERKKRIAVLSPNTVSDMLPKLDRDFLRRLSDTQIRGLDYSKATDKQIEEIFCDYNYDDKEKCHRIALLPSNAVSDMLPKLDRDFLRRLSDTQIRGLDYSKATNEQIKEIFCDYHYDDKETCRRIAFLALDTVIAMLPKLDSDFLCRLSDNQVHWLDYSKVTKGHLEAIFFCNYDDTEKCRRIALIPRQSIKFAVRVASSDFLKHLSKEQVAALDVSLLKKEQIDDIFFNFGGTEARQAKVARLPIASVNNLVQRGFGKVLEYISTSQLSQINVTNLAQKEVDLLFPSLDPAKWFPNHTYSVRQQGASYLHEWKENSSHSSGRHSSSEEFFGFELEKKQNQCCQSFQALSPEKFAAIRNKISPEVVAFLTQ